MSCASKNLDPQVSYYIHALAFVPTHLGIVTLKPAWPPLHVSTKK